MTSGPSSAPGDTEHAGEPVTETDWKARAEDAERRAAEAWEAYHRVAAERADAAHYKHLLETREASFSWRITAPLRLARLAVRWFVRKARAALAQR